MEQPPSRATVAICISMMVLVLTASLPASFLSGSGPTNQYSSPGSWALGVVVPESSSLSNGGRVSWESVDNVTVSIRLPEINGTDDTIYAILSVMTDDGAILQLASGLLPNASSWGTYAMLIRNPTAYPQEYRIISSTKAPEAAPGALVSLSIYYARGTWNFDAKDPNANQTVHSVLNESISSSLKVGDQEVFSLESYSSAISVFENMGNLTLEKVLLNGRQVSGGWYLYNGGWNPSHTPLFAVGGSSPPSYVAAQSCGPNIACWNHGGQWSQVGGPTPPLGVLYALFSTAAAALLVVATVALFGRRRSQRSIP